MGAQKVGPRVAIIKNFTEEKATWAADMITSFEKLIRCSAPSASVEVFNAIVDPELPNADNFDIVILTGGTYNLTLPELEPWVTREAEWVRQMATNAPETRLIGVCWGHQLICRALGGMVEPTPETYAVGPYPERLTAAGQSLFNTNSVELPQFRLRRVGQPGAGAVVLAEDNSMLFYPERNIVSFQGHPEFSSAISNSILGASGDAFTRYMDDKEVARIRASFDDAHDGETAFGSIMAWATGHRVISTA